jgi:hypothetical protein
MAITNVDLVVGRKKTAGGAATPWAVAFTSADASGCEVIKAAPDAGALYIEKLTVNCASDINVSFGVDEATSALVLNWLTLNMETTSPPFVWEPKREVAVLTALGAAGAFCVDASGAGAITGVVEGFTV